VRSEKRWRNRGSWSMKRIEQVRDDFVRALAALEDATKVAKNDLEIDGALQRFEFTFELYWKLLKLHLAGEGIIVNSPKQCLKESFRLQLLTEEEIGLQMLDDRNMTVHLYDRRITREIFERVKSLYVGMLRDSLAKIVGEPRAL